MPEVKKKTAKKRGKGRRDGGETERAFIDVAARLFAERGYNGTSVADIAKEMGLTNASLYYYTSGKQELLLRVLAAGIAEFLSRLEEIAAREMDAKQRLRSAVENHLYFVLHNKNAVAVFLRERRFLEEQYRLQYQEQVDKYDSLFNGIIRDCMKEGSIPSGDAQLFRLAILGMINWVVEWYSDEGRLTREEISETLTDLIIDRMLAPAP